MARRRSRHLGGDSNQVKGFAERIATATKPEPSKTEAGDAPTVITQGLTRYQRRTANLPSGATPLTVEERTSIVVDLRHLDEEED